MITDIIRAIGWPLVIVCCAAFAWRVYRMTQVPANAKGRVWSEPFHPSNWLALLLWGGAAVAILTVLGVVSPARGAEIAGGALGVAALLARPWKREGRHALKGQIRYGITEPAGAARHLLAGRLGSLSCAGSGDDGHGEMEAVVADHVARRSIPPVRIDPALGAPAELTEITAAPVAGDHAGAIARIAAFEPETDADEIAFLKGEAAAMAAYAQAWQSHAEICLGSVGLDPAFAAGVLEAADSIGDTAHDLTLVHRRLIVIYAAVNEAIAGGLILPHKAREWLSGGEAA